MKIALSLLALGLVTATAGAASVRTVGAPAPVSSLAFDGSRIAYATGRSARDCNRVYAWNLATRGVMRFGRKTHCVQTSTGNAIAGVSIAGTRVLWVHYVGGNQRDWTLWTATTTRPAPVRLRSVTRDVDAPAPIVAGVGDDSRLGSLLPYAVDSTVIALRANGSRAFSWEAPARVLDLAADAGRLAVATAGGTVTVLGSTGKVLSVERFGGEIDAVRLTGDTLVVQHGRTLELRGGRVALFTLVRGVTLTDAGGGRAVLVGGGKVRAFDLDSGSGGIVAAGSFARVEGRRLATASGRTVALR